MSVLRGIILCTVALLSGFASAATPVDYNVVGTTAFRAFECAALAGLADKDAEAQRLFDIGLNNARVFAKAGFDGKLNEKNSGNVPLGWHMIGGPTPDFLAGRVYELATRDTHKLETSPLLAYDEKNCSLIR